MKPKKNNIKSPKSTNSKNNNLRRRTFYCVRRHFSFKIRNVTNFFFRYDVKNYTPSYHPFFSSLHRWHGRIRLFLCSILMMDKISLELCLIMAFYKFLSYIMLKISYEVYNLNIYFNCSSICVCVINSYMCRLHIFESHFDTHTNL
jgi:hypothetical protein